MVLVTSANGRVGRLVINALVKKGFKIRALDINPAAQSLKSIGVDEVVVGDAGEPKVIRAALAGATQVVYIPPMLLYTETALANLCVDEAIEAGVGHFVMLSVTHPDLSLLLQHTMKLKAEEHLKLQGFKHELNFTILQPLHYTHNVIVEDMLESGRYPNFKPLNKKLGYVDGEDVAEATAKVLAEGEKHRYATYQLCGRSHLSVLEIAEMFTRISGVPLETTYTERENFFRDFPNFVGSGNDSYAKAAVLAIRDTYNDYGFDANCNVLEWLLERPSTTMEQYIRRELERLGAPARP